MFGEKNGRQLQSLLSKFQDVFSIPKSLPPLRPQDHGIQLKEGTNRPNLRPYRYPNVLKDKVKGMVQEMLNSGIIQPSISPYSSFVVLVKKNNS